MNKIALGILLALSLFIATALGLARTSGCNCEGGYWMQEELLFADQNCTVIRYRCSNAVSCAYGKEEVCCTGIGCTVVECNTCQ